MPAEPPPGRSLYEAILGERFGALHPEVRRAHLPPLVATGTFDVEHGRHRLVGFLVALMSLPAAGPRQPVRLDAVEVGDRLAWARRIGPSVLRTIQHAAGPRLVEQLGIGRVAFDLAVDRGSLVYRQAWMRVGPVTIPPSVSPRVEARVSPAARGWHVEVTVLWRGRLVCHYGGVMEPT